MPVCGRSPTAVVTKTLLPQITGESGPARHRAPPAHVRAAFRSQVSGGCWESAIPVAPAPRKPGQGCGSTTGTYGSGARRGAVAGAGALAAPASSAASAAGGSFAPLATSTSTTAIAPTAAACWQAESSTVWGTSMDSTTAATASACPLLAAARGHRPALGALLDEHPHAVGVADPGGHADGRVAVEAVGHVQSGGPRRPGPRRPGMVARRREVHRRGVELGARVHVGTGVEQLADGGHVAALGSLPEACHGGSRRGPETDEEARARARSSANIGLLRERCWPRNCVGMLARPPQARTRPSIEAPPGRTSIGIDPASPRASVQLPGSIPCNAKVPSGAAGVRRGCAQRRVGRAPRHDLRKAPAVHPCPPARLPPGPLPVILGLPSRA